MASRLGASAEMAWWIVASNLSFRGRASRRWFYAATGVVYLLGLIALLPYVGLVFLGGDKASVGVALFSVILLAISLANGAVLAGAVVRRLHDRGKASWWLLIFFGPHAALTWMLTQIPSSQQTLSAAVLLAGLPLDAPFIAWGLTEIFLLRGQHGDNRYGPDPVRLTNP